MADEVTIVVRAKDEFSSTLGNFGNIITGIKSAIDLAAGAFRTFGDFAMQGLDAIASYERMAASLETLVAKEMLATGSAMNMAQALQMSGDEAEQLLIWNQQLAINSPFTSEGVNNALRMAMAYGFTVDEAKRLTEALIDFAAGSGATEASMEAIARALGQISATGKVTGGDMLQLVNAGLPVTEILAEGFGVTTAKLMEMRSAGLLPATEAIEYITRYLEENFAGAAERQANTWAGLQGTFADLKEMGLREFFQGLFDVLQPLAVEFSSWLQTEGMDKFSEWGENLGIFAQAVSDLVTGNKLYDLGAQLQSLGDKQSIFYALGTAIRVFQQAIDDGKSSRDAFLSSLDKFQDLSGIDIQIAVDMIFDGITEENIKEMLTVLDEKLAKGIEGYDWSKSGDSFGTALVSAIEKSGETNKAWYDHLPFVVGGKFILGILKSESISALAKGISDWLLAAMNMQNWGEFMPRLMSLYDVGMNIGKSIGDGMRASMQDFWHDVGVWIDVYIIDPVKKALGISSPSTVFMDIGKNIVLGLIEGVSSMWSNFVDFLQTKLSNLLSNISPENILKIITGDMTLSELFGGSSSGSFQPYSPGGYNPGGYQIPNSSSGSGQNVVNNFYGPVYFGNLSQMGYDCPPSELVTATSGLINIEGFG